MRHTLKTIRDNDGEMLMVSVRPMTESDWPVYFVVRLIETEDYDREWAQQGRYHVELSAVAPEAAGPEGLRGAADSWGLTADDMTSENGWTVHSSVEVLHSYGIKAPLFQAQGNNRDKLLRAARKELGTITFLFGFYMDRTVNAIGESGWDWIAGGAGSTLTSHRA